MLVSLPFLQGIEHFHYTMTGILLSNKTLQSIYNKCYFSLYCFTHARQNLQLTLLPIKEGKPNHCTSWPLAARYTVPVHQPFKHTGNLGHRLKRYPYSQVNNSVYISMTTFFSVLT